MTGDMFDAVLAPRVDQRDAWPTGSFSLDVEIWLQAVTVAAGLEAGVNLADALPRLFGVHWHHKRAEPEQLTFELTDTDNASRGVTHERDDQPMP